MFAASAPWNDASSAIDVPGLPVGVGQFVDLVEHGDARLVEQLEDAQRVLDGLALARGVGCVMSMTCSSNVASVSSSSVARNAATSCVGSFG